MTKSLFTSDEIIINGHIDSVWDALINPEKTKLYMYGCEVISDWKEGDELIWKGAADGVVYVKGHLVKLISNQEFSFTVIDPNASYPDIPENYLTASYTITQQEDLIHLKVTQGDYTKVAEGVKRYDDTVKSGGWMPVLEAIKKIVEGGDNG